MANLRCHTYFCAYNDCTHCNKETPNVDKKATCISFMHKVNNKHELYDYEYAEERKFSLKNDSHDIPCESYSCMNNFNHYCNANHVRFDTVEDKTMCMNYRKKD